MRTSSPRSRWLMGWTGEPSSPDERRRSASRSSLGSARRCRRPYPTPCLHSRTPHSSPPHAPFPTHLLPRTSLHSPRPSNGAEALKRCRGSARCCRRRRPTPCLPAITPYQNLPALPSFLTHISLPTPPCARPSTRIVQHLPSLTPISTHLLPTTHLFPHTHPSHAPPHVPPSAPALPSSHPA